jgi:hypothetical protein
MNLGLSFCDGVARLVIFPLDVGYQIAKLHQDSLLTPTSSNTVSDQDIKGIVIIIRAMLLMATFIF